MIYNLRRINFWFGNNNVRTYYICLYIQCLLSQSFRIITLSICCVCIYHAIFTTDTANGIQLHNSSAIILAIFFLCAVVLWMKVSHVDKTIVCSSYWTRNTTISPHILAKRIRKCGNNIVSKFIIERSTGCSKLTEILVWIITPTRITQNSNNITIYK